jgi:ACS family D-galactonate transporter-like MFS transporter
VNAAVFYALVIGIDIGIVLMNIPPVIDTFMSLYRTSYTGVSILISSIMWTHGLMQIPGGLLIDRLGVRGGVALSLAAMSAGNLLPLLGVNFTLAVIGRVFCGVGTGLGFVTTMKWVALSVPKSRIGVYQAYLGGIIALGSILPFLFFPGLSRCGWEAVFVAPGVFSLALLAVLPALRSNPLPASAVSFSVSSSLIFSSRPWLFGFIQSLSWGPVVAFGNWGASILSEAHPNIVRAENLAWFGASVMAISGVVRILGGPLIGRFSPRGIILGSNLLLGIAHAFLFSVHDPGVLLPLLLATTALASINFGAIFHLVSTSVPPSSLGLMLGVVIFTANMGAFLLTFLFGWMKDLTGGFHSAFAWTAPFFILAMAATQTVAPRKQERKDPSNREV